MQMLRNKLAMQTIRLHQLGNMSSGILTNKLKKSAIIQEGEIKERIIISSNVKTRALNSKS